MNDFLEYELSGFIEPEEIEMTDVAKVPVWLMLILGIRVINKFNFARNLGKATERSPFFKPVCRRIKKKCYFCSSLTK